MLTGGGACGRKLAREVMDGVKFKAHY